MLKYVIFKMNMDRKWRRLMLVGWCKSNIFNRLWKGSIVNAHLASLVKQSHVQEPTPGAKPCRHDDCGPVRRVHLRGKIRYDLNTILGTYKSGMKPYNSQSVGRIKININSVVNAKKQDEI